MDLDSFLENIDLECEGRDEIISKKAYQIDDKGRGENIKKGIKSSLGVDSIKSCDYFFQKENEVIFIEISNFLKQFESLKNSFENIIDKISKEDKEFIRKYMTPEKIIKSEIKNKYLNTLLILNYFQIVDITKKKIYILVFCEENKSLVRIFDKMSRDLKSDLKSLLTDIKIILKNELEKFL